MNMGKKILMLCYYYPPMTDVGCKKSVAFSKFLKKFGWEPFVVSVENPDRVWCSVGDEKPPEGVHVEYCRSIVNPYWLLGKLNGVFTRLVRVFGIEVKRNYFYDLTCIPDHLIGWIPSSVIRSIRRIKKHKIDFIYVSCPPFSAAISGVLVKFFTGKKLILDFRDVFALETSAFNRLSSPRRFASGRIENFLIRNVDTFIVTTEDTKEEYLVKYPSLQGRIHTIHNGFDPDYLFEEKVEKFPVFTVCYTGQIYLYDPDFQSGTYAFFEAMRLLKERNIVSKDNFRFLFYGNSKEDVKLLGESYGVPELIDVHDRVPYRDILNIIARSHLQLIKSKKHAITTKLYEGIPLNTPYLATIQCGETERIVREFSPSSYVITDESPEKIAASIQDAMAKYASHEIQANRVEEFLQKFSRQNQTIKLIDILAGQAAA